MNTYDHPRTRVVTSRAWYQTLTPHTCTSADELQMICSSTTGEPKELGYEAHDHEMPTGSGSPGFSSPSISSPPVNPDAADAPPV